MTSRTRLLTNLKDGLADGIARVVLRSSGIWYVKFIHMVPGTVADRQRLVEQGRRQGLLEVLLSRASAPLALRLGHSVQDERRPYVSRVRVLTEVVMNAARASRRPLTMRALAGVLCAMPLTVSCSNRARPPAPVEQRGAAVGARETAEPMPEHPPLAADLVVAPLPAGTLPWERPAELTGDARPWWREQLQRVTIVDRRAGACRPRGPAFEKALAMECGVVLAGLKPGTRRSEVEALLEPFGGRFERFPDDAYAEAVLRVRAGTEPAAALRLLDDTARVRYVSFKWVGTLPSHSLPMPPVAPPLVEHVVEGVAVTLSARPLVVAPGDSVRFVATAHNSSGRRVKLSDQCGPPMDVVITGPGGYRVWVLSEMLGPHGDFTCETRRSHYAERGETERQRLAWRAPNRRGEYTAIAGLRGVYVLKHLSAPLQIIVR